MLSREWEPVWSMQESCIQCFKHARCAGIRLARIPRKHAA